MSYDSAPVPLRAKAVNAKKLLSEVDPDQPDPPPRLEWQRGQKAESAAAELPKECEWGCKKDSQGKTKFWKGGKVHVGTRRGGVPVACVYTSASLHDSQAAIPLMRQASERLEYRFDLMDAAYDAEPIHDESRELGHVPVIDANRRRSPEARRMTELEKEIYKDRSADDADALLTRFSSRRFHSPTSLRSISLSHPGKSPAWTAPQRRRNRSSRRFSTPSPIFLPPSAMSSSLAEWISPRNTSNPHAHQSQLNATCGFAITSTLKYPLASQIPLFVSGQTSPSPLRGSRSGRRAGLRRRP